MATSPNDTDDNHIHRLAFEILSEIFVQCLSSDRLPRARLDEPPLTISQVCRSWRTISLQTQRLWARLHVMCNDDDSIRERSLLALREWLVRSGTTDIVLAIECSKGMTQFEPNLGRDLSEGSPVSWVALEPVMQEIIKHSDRLKDVTLIIPDTCTKDTVALVQRNLLSLNALNMQFFRTPAYMYIRSPQLDEAFAPLFANLKELEVDSELAFQLSVGKFPACPALRKLAIHQFSVNTDTIIAVLGKCPLLEEFRFSPPNTTGWSLSPPTMLNSGVPIETSTFTSIRALHLQANGYYTYIVGSLLDKLVLPQLINLSIAFDEEQNVHSSWSHLVDFLKRSDSQLESLSLINDAMSPSDLIICLEQVPRLKYLRACLSERLAEALTFNAPSSSQVVQGGIVCPLLETIAFNWTERQRASKARTAWACAKMLRSRCDRGKAGLDGDLLTGGLRRVYLPTEMLNELSIQDVVQYAGEGRVVDIGKLL